MLNKDLLYKGATPMKLNRITKACNINKTAPDKSGAVHYKLPVIKLSVHTCQELCIIFCSLHVLQ